MKLRNIIKRLSLEGGHLFIAVNDIGLAPEVLRWMMPEVIKRARVPAPASAVAIGSNSRANCRFSRRFGDFIVEVVHECLLSSRQLHFPDAFVFNLMDGQGN